jgi:hypothetical protein
MWVQYLPGQFCAVFTWATLILFLFFNNGGFLTVDCSREEAAN